ncbi:MAG TPA: nitrogenase cofactor biosynthesis protein NifB [Nitrospirae bacterium]|nr:feMo cofactor biosynthesis protein NifB [bacterium BMS3Abin06]HDH11530.1 nitrogenase cofactor biosynthesis protein NifB [Nitrospirota bacterium]HDZ03399.1 nitrogenase cofactor biosynthesis protein NifB [Nitrospirota bacterium]
MSSFNERNNRDIIKNHPCFSEEAHHKFGRIHLPVAPACNIQCKYCKRKYDCANESRPGITSRILTPPEALERVRSLVERNERLTVIGIAGPGDPLANDATFEVFRAINREYPELTLCVSTNGLLLPDRLEELLESGVSSLTVTINAVIPEIAEKIYSWVSYRGRQYSGKPAVDLLLENQWSGLSKAVDAGLIVKVNTVLIPGINDSEIPFIAWLAGKRGAELMNIMPLIPKAEFEHFQRPSLEDLNIMRKKCKKYVPQMTHCKQCRADACGEIGEDKDMELEVLLSKIGEVYNEMVV